MPRYRARWVLPITGPPVRGGWVETGDGRVLALGGPDSAGPGRGDDVVLDDHALLPALVNAHTHLELSGLRGTVPRASSMPAWARDAMSRMAVQPPDPRSIRTAIDEMRASGTGLVGDISNTLASVRPLVESGLEAVVFHELIGFDLVDARPRVEEALEQLRHQTLGATTVRGALAAHAPYSVSPSLFRAIREARVGDDAARRAVHLGESVEELTFLRSGDGAWREVLEARGRWTDRWTPPGTGPVDYLDGLGWLGPETVVVHGVQLTDAELSRLAAVGATLVSCPRSNVWTGAGPPPVARFVAAGVQVAWGTDSLASAPDLDLFAELAAVRRVAPTVPAAAILRGATEVGARALGHADRGTIAPGAVASLVAVRCPDGVDDVEEYLVSGVDPAQVVWPAAPSFMS